MINLPGGQAIVDKLISETFSKALKKISLLKEEMEHYGKNKFLPYLNNEYEKLNVATSVLFVNNSKKLDDLYVPLTFKREGEIEIKIDAYPGRLFNISKRIIVVDDAGMGKSTALKMVFRFAYQSGSIIPFFIDIKSLVCDDKVISVSDYLIKIFPSFRDKPSESFYLDIFNNCRLLFIFDGADEVPDKYRREAFSKINHFCDCSKHSYFLIATRSEESVLSSFYTFKSVQIMPLSIDESYALLSKYEFVDSPSNILIHEIEKDENKSVRGFLTNPLLTTLLYMAFSYKKKIPFKKVLFYQQVYEALYETHDTNKAGYLEREKKSKLDISQFEKILAYVAFIGRIDEKIKYTRNELYLLIEGSKKVFPTLNFNPDSFFDDILYRVPVFRRDGLYFLWQHKSIQEYFFVRYLLVGASSKDRDSILVKMLYSKKFFKYKLIFDFLFDNDEELFHRLITAEIWNSKRESASGSLVNPFSNLEKLYVYQASMYDISLSDPKRIRSDTVLTNKGNNSEYFINTLDNTVRNRIILNFIQDERRFKHNRNDFIHVQLKRIIEDDNNIFLISNDFKVLIIFEIQRKPFAMIARLLYEKKVPFVKLAYMSSRGSEKTMRQVFTDNKFSENQFREYMSALLNVSSEKNDLLLHTPLVYFYFDFDLCEEYLNKINESYSTKNKILELANKL